MTGKTGICTLAYMPMRADASHRSEMTSMILFGEMYRVIKQADSWLNIEMCHDGYKGWVDTSSPFFIDEAYAFSLQQMNIPVLSRPQEQVWLNHCSQKISCGSSLPFSVMPELAEDFHLGSLYHLPSQNFDFDFVFSLAEQYLGTPYLWGGRSIWGIDCSGYMQILFRMAGLKLPRDAWQQAERGNEVNFDDAQPGDLAFFENKEKRIFHVGMLIPEYKIIHASYKVRIDTFTKDGILNNESGKLSHHLAVIKRIRTSSG